MTTAAAIKALIPINDVLSAMARLLLYRSGKLRPGE
jgi:hypothetical protein